MTRIPLYKDKLASVGRRVLELAAENKIIPKRHPRQCSKTPS